MKRGKKYQDAIKKIDKTQAYDIPGAVKLLKEVAYANFDETVGVAFSLRIKKSHTIRDTVVLPNSFGKEKRILVFAKGDKVKEAQEAGAMYVGDTEYVDKIKDGWLEFDVIVATPDMMKDVGKLGPILGRRGLMPNPKLGTVTTDVKGAIAELKKGRSEFRANKNGVVHLSVGKMSMDDEKLEENIRVFYSEILRKKPSDLKGEYIGSMYIASTMSPGIKINSKTIN